MGFSSYLLLLLTHPYEFRTLVQYKLYHGSDDSKDITLPANFPTSGYDRETMRRCWYFLDMTSRSFSVVIKELEGDLSRVICLFYLTLRALDTIEDDMTIPEADKQPLLRSFHAHTVTPGWNFNGNGPAEKDRQLLVEYHVVIDELLNHMNKEYRDIIVDITNKMAVGMADFTLYFSKQKGSSSSPPGIPNLETYDLYCHYVAGLVGEGLSRLFSASGKESPGLAKELVISNSVGILLQKTNIIRDFREDVEEGRGFWPKEVWGDFGGFNSMADMKLPVSGPVDPLLRSKSLYVSSHLILDALRHSIHALTYLRMIKNQSVFNFVAIPLSMAMATLELCFMNDEVFKRNVKIRRAQGAKLIMRSTNPREVSLIFKEYARKIHAKASPDDPNFTKIAIACAKIDQWHEQHYPSFVQIDVGESGPKIMMDPLDARTRVYEVETKNEEKLTKERRIWQIRQGLAGNPTANVATTDAESQREMFMYIIGAFVLVLGVCGSVVGGIVWYTGATY